MKSIFLVCSLMTVLLITAPLADAQQAGKIHRIGVLDPSTASGSAVLWEAFREELRKLGWNEGKNITVEYRFAEQKGERLTDLAAKLVRLKVDLIVVPDTPATLAVKNASSAVPIVMVNPADPVGAGLVTSLAQPGGNVTGLSSLSPELGTKRLEILKDAVPNLSRVAFVRVKTVGANLASQLKEIRPAAAALKLKLEEIETQLDPKSLDSAFQRRSRSKSTRF